MQWSLRAAEACRRCCANSVCQVRPRRYWPGAPRCRSRGVGGPSSGRIVEQASSPGIPGRCSGPKGCASPWQRRSLPLCCLALRINCLHACASPPPLVQSISQLSLPDEVLIRAQMSSFLLETVTVHSCPASFPWFLSFYPCSEESPNQHARLSLCTRPLL